MDRAGHTDRRVDGRGWTHGQESRRTGLDTWTGELMDRAGHTDKIVDGQGWTHGQDS